MTHKNVFCNKVLEQQLSAICVYATVIQCVMLKNDYQLKKEEETNKEIKTR